MTTFDKMSYEKSYFNASDLNVEPLIINRKLSSFDHPIIIIQSQISHSSYNSLLNLIRYSLGDLNIGQKIEYDFIKPENKFKKDRVYFMDLRKEKDAGLESCDLINYDLVPMWVRNSSFDFIVNNSRGLVIFCDNYKDVPDCVLSRSIISLSDETDTLKLREFLARIGNGINSFPELNTDVEKNTLKGIYKGINWLKKVVY